MTSRARILEAIRAHKPTRRPLPELPFAEGRPGELVERFCEALPLVGAGWIRETDLGEWPAFLAARYPEARWLTTTIAELVAHGVSALPQVDAPTDLKAVDVAVIEGSIGVAENGAVWVSEQDLVIRVLPFITQHLVIRLEESRIVPTMHEAYRKIAKKGWEGFGVFIAGPSKTADIEQALVKGAQGARSALIVLAQQ